MKACVHILLIWLLVLAIPAQGFAAAAQTGCSSWQKIRGGPHVDLPVTATHKLHLQAIEVLSITPHTHAGYQDHAKQPQGQGLPASCSFCGACAVCYVGASMLMLPDQFLLLPRSAEIHRATGRQTFVSHIPEHPERPPSLSA